jgi:hypothetical protein
MLTETQIELEELKFCLITCEVAYNTELAELLSLSKRSVSWADPLPTFNRRTIATTIERGMAEAYCVSLHYNQVSVLMNG